MIDRLMADPDTQWNFLHVYNLPIVLRKFFFDQFIARQEKKIEDAEKAKSK